MLRTIASLAFATTALAPFAGAQVRQIGPLTESERVLAASHRSSLIAVAVDEDGDLLRTGDGGASYVPLDTSAMPGLFAADFDGSGACFVASPDRVHVSTDGAATFTPGAALASEVRALAASTLVGGEVWALLADGSIHRSTDFASSWTQVGSLGMAVDPSNEPGIDPHPFRPGEWLVHAFRTLWHTEDSGQTSSQTSVLAFFGGTVQDAALVGEHWVVSIHHNQHGLLFNDLAYSSDAGATWNLSYTGFLEAGALRVSPHNPDEVWVVRYQDGLLRSVDGGQSFVQVSPGVGSRTDIDFSSDPARPLHASTPSMLGTADLTAGTFSPAEGGRNAVHVRDFDVDPRDPMHLVAVTRFTRGTVFETFDGGDNWSVVASNLVGATAAGQTTGAEIDGNGRVFVHRPHLRLYTGTSWTALSPGSGDVTALATSRVDPDLVYATLERADRDVLAVSRDGGFNWTRVEICTDPAGGSCADTEFRTIHLVERPGAPTRVVLVTLDGLRIEFTDDEGLSVVGAIPGGQPVQLGQSPRDGARFAVWRAGAVFLTDDAFATTTAPLSSPFGEAGLVASSEDPDLIVGAAPGGPSVAPTVGVSTDGGVTWAARPEWTLGVRTVEALGLSADETELYVAGDPGLFAIPLRDAPAATVCTQTVPNSVGHFAGLGVTGSASATANEARLEATGLPPYVVCLPLASDATVQTPGAGGSLGTLCLAGQIGRFNFDIGTSTAAGAFGFDLDTQLLPRGAQPIPAVAGERWFFQCWYRDVDMGGAPSSHFTEAVEVTWLP